MCPLCLDSGWVSAAGLSPRVTAEGQRDFVGEFHPIPCFACSRYRVFMKES